jgi:hypothetical protein
VRNYLLNLVRAVLGVSSETVEDRLYDAVEDYFEAEPGIEKWAALAHLHSSIRLVQGASVMADDESLKDRMYKDWAVAIAEASSKAAAIGMPIDSETLVGVTVGALLAVCADEIEKAQLRIAKLELKEAQREDYENSRNTHE